MSGFSDLSWSELAERACRERDAALREVERLRAALGEMLRGGQHDGPCTNEGDPYDSCDLHGEAAERRRAQARAISP